MQKPNLLYIITKLELGGAQKNVLDLAAGLSDTYNICIYTCREGELMAEALAIKGCRVFVSWALDRPLNPFKDLLALIELWRFLKKNKFDIIHTHSSKAGIIGRFAARLAGVKTVVHTVHGWSFNRWQPWPVRSLYRALERLAARCCRTIIVVSEADRKRGMEAKIGVLRQYALVRYGIDKARFLNVTAPRNPAPVVGTVACLKPQKAPLDFFKLTVALAERFPEARFVIAGDGELRPRMELLINAAGYKERLRLLGWRRDIPELVSSLDVFCLTSLWEGLPIAALEAMAAGKPVVCTDTGGISEVIENGTNGFLVKPGDIRNMADTVARLITDEGLRARVGQRAAARIDEGFSLETMVGTTAAIYVDARLRAGQKELSHEKR